MKVVLIKRIPALFSQTNRPVFPYRVWMFSLSLLFCLIPLMPLNLKASVVLQVDIQGLDDEIASAVRQNVQIFRQKDNPRLSVWEMQRLHKKAKTEIAVGLKPFGFYSAEINGSLVENEEGWFALYHVNTGPICRIRKLELQINGMGKNLPEFDDLADQFPLQPGDALLHASYEAGKRYVLKQCKEAGFLEARFITHTLSIRRVKNVADIHLLVDSGARFHFGKISFNSDIIRPELLRRYFPVKEGENYSSRELIRLQSILYDTNYFSSVIVDPKLSEAVDQHIPIDLMLDPIKKNQYSLGIGYGTDTGVRGKIGWKNRLINARGHKAHIELQLSEKNGSLESAYQVPVFDPRFDIFSYGLNWLDDSWDDTETELWSGDISLTHDGPVHQITGRLEFRTEEYTVGVTSGKSQLFIPGIRWSVTKTDNRVNTKNGTGLSLNIRGAHEDFLSDTTFLQTRVNGKLIYSVFPKIRLIGRFSLGATDVDDIDSMPPLLRFYAGGDQSVRGYAYKSLGTEDASGVVIGGRYLVVGSVEVEQLMGENWSIAAFYDTGNAMDDLDIELKQGAGIGFRYILPFGRIRADVATALSEEGFPLRLHLTVGADL